MIWICLRRSEKEVIITVDRIPDCCQLHHYHSIRGSEGFSSVLLMTAGDMMLEINCIAGTASKSSSIMS